MNLELPKDTETTKIVQIKIVVECSKCGKAWAFYLSRVTPMSMICLDCLQKKFLASESQPGVGL